MRVDAGLLQIRRAQVASALAALELDERSADPLFDAWPEELLDAFTLASGAGLRTLEVATPTAPDPEVLDALAEALGREFAHRWALEETLSALDADGTEVGLRASPDAPPALRVTLVGAWSPSRIHATLGALGLPADPLGTWSDLLGRLLVDRPVALDVISRAGDPAPTLRTAFAYAVSPEHHRPLQVQLDRTAEALGVAPPQRRWFAGMVPAFADRPLSHLEIRLDIDGRVVMPRLAVRYPSIPARRVLKVITDFGRRSSPGARFGALMAAAGADDEVDWLELAIASGAQALPTAAFAVTGHGPP